MRNVPTIAFGVLFFASWFLFSAPAQAASLYIDPPSTALNRGDAVTLSIRLDTDEQTGECVNAVDAVLTYTSNIEPVDVSVGDSIFSIWVEAPTINKEDHTITFAGGIPNGYCGRIIGDPRLTNVLAKVVFRSPGFTIGTAGTDETSARVEFTDESTAYLNDGRGTKASLITYGATMELSQKAGSGLVNPWKQEVNADTIRPEQFSITLHKDDKAFSQKYYIVFNTTDKQTGVDHYEIMEEPLTQFGSFQWGRADAPWVKARSPYVLEDQSLNSIVRVKAIDKAGNEYIATYIPDESLRTLSQTQVTTIVFVALAGLLFIVIAVVAFWYTRRKLRKKKEITEPVEDLSGQPDQTISTANDEELYDDK